MLKQLRDAGLTLVLVSSVGLSSSRPPSNEQIDALRAGPIPALDGTCDPSEPGKTAPSRTIFIGSVVGPDGAPRPGAVVVTSAGGRAISDSDGSFRLALELPEAAESVHVTAVANSYVGSLIGSKLVSGCTPGAWTSLGTIALEPMGSCSPSWLPTFGGHPGLNAIPQALAVFDDGDGPALYAGGGFTSAEGQTVGFIARWDGSRWSPLGSGLDDLVFALAVFDDGGGPALYAGGDFTSAGGLSANHVAKWNGSSWSALGNGVNATVNALCVFDDQSGGGPALYATGSFASAGGAAASRIAKWNGSSWSALGSGLNGEGFALCVFDDGGGAELYAGGSFTSAGGSAANRIARWNGASWSALTSGANERVRALVAFDDGNGPALYVGGDFTLAGGVANTRRIAKWNGASWSALALGMNDDVRALAVFDDQSGGGPTLYAGGVFTATGGMTVNHIAKWNGASWSSAGFGLTERVLSLAVFDDGDGGGAALYVGGAFTTAGGLQVNYIVEWDGSALSALGGSGLDAGVRALAVFDDGNGPALYAGGHFRRADGVALNSIAKWDGSSWSPLGSGTSSIVEALAVFDDGSGGGPALYAGGWFGSAGGVLVNLVAKWDLSSWSPLGQGLTGNGYTLPFVSALAVFDDGLGSGPALYAAGEFVSASGVPANRIAKWDGSSWSALSSGLDAEVRALCTFDDGSGGGPALYAGGLFFNAGGVPASRIAQWDGTQWAALGSGVSGQSAQVQALAAFDDGGGHALFTGGFFPVAGGTPANSIAKWDGASWSPLGSGTNLVVYSLAAHDEGTGGGPALYAGGNLTLAGGMAANRIAKWDGASWSPLGSGMDLYVFALASFDDGIGGGPALYAGGWFTSAIDSSDSYIAKWGCPGPGPGTAYCFGDGSGAPCPCNNEDPGGAGGCANSSGSGVVLSGTGTSNTANDTVTLFGSGLIGNQPGLLFQADNAVNGGQGVAFGDGLRCAGGGVIRIEVLFPDANGEVAYPGPGDPSISSEGQVQAGDTKRYQLWYRNVTGGPCASGFNLSNGYEIAWQ